LFVVIAERFAVTKLTDKRRPTTPNRSAIVDKQDQRFLLLWLYTIFAVPIFIIFSFWITGFLGFKIM